VEVVSCIRVLSLGQENWLLVLRVWKSCKLVLLAKTHRELCLLQKNMVFFFPFVTLGGVLACLNGSLLLVVGGGIF